MFILFFSFNIVVNSSVKNAKLFFNQLWFSLFFIWKIKFREHNLRFYSWAARSDKRIKNPVNEKFKLHEKIFALLDVNAVAALSLMRECYQNRQFFSFVESLRFSSQICWTVLNQCLSRKLEKKFNFLFSYITFIQLSQNVCKT